MPPRQEQFAVEEKSWTELLHHSRFWRNISRKCLNATLHHFAVFVDETGSDRLLALGGTGQSLQQTLYSAPLTRSTLVPSPSKLTLLPYLQHQFVSGGPPPHELAALCERQRTTIAVGISSYHYDTNTHTLLYSDTTSLYRTKGETKNQIGAGISGCPLHARMCPADNDLAAFVSNSTIHIDWKGDIIYSATTRENITNGCASFITQEELNRYVGMWWSPAPHKMLLYEQCDESNVTSLHFACPGSPAVLSMKYPLAGTANSISLLRMIVLYDDKIVDRRLSVDLKSIYPWYEYLARVGWLSDGSAVWAILLNRLQDRYALIVIPVELFTRDSSLSRVVTLIDEKTDVWFNVDNLTSFVTSSPQCLNFIHTNAKDDLTHLYYYSASFDEANRMVSCISKTITSGNWSVMKEPGLYIDEKRRHVYFVANKQQPPDSNLCVASYGSPSETKILTETSLSYRTERMESELSVNPEIGFVCWQSSLGTPPQCAFYRLRHMDENLLPEAVLQHIIELPQMTVPPELQVDPCTSDSGKPELIKFYSENSKRNHYALLIRPFNASNEKQYPVIQVVYGGPGVQLVRNAWSSWVTFRKYTRLGYAVLMVDGRGSSNRGLAFEAPLKFKMGTVEIDDQIEGLREVAKRANGLLDLTRVAVMGWSYGGYLSLLCIAKHPEIYKAAVVGGAVTSWRQYDTAYTERYMGIPSDPIYKDASVLSYVNQLPNEFDRLYIAHGLIDENVHFSHTERLIDALIAAGKPYSLQIFPSERHGVRSVDASEFHDASILAFLQKALR